MSVSQFYILSARGDTIINKDYRGDIPPGSQEIFFRKMKFWGKGDAPPVFNEGGMNFLFMKKNGLYFVATTKCNISPSLILELIDRLTKIFKDYCGVLTEEAIRKNFVLIYELLDETLDYGFAQGTSTEILKSHVHNEPIATDASVHTAFNIPSMKSNFKSSTAVRKPIAVTGDQAKKGENEIFCDILEQLNVVFNAGGQVLNSSIEGRIQMKSYLAGNPELRLALNEDLVIGKGNQQSYGAVVLDDCNFHDCVQLDEFERERVLHFVPPDGEFTVINYRITGMTIFLLPAFSSKPLLNAALRTIRTVPQATSAHHFASFRSSKNYPP
jgi:AP-4 complex subunit mu-1